MGSQYILILYISATIIIGLIFKRKDNYNSFHGTNLGTLMCVAIGAGEWLGGNSTIGVAEYGYEFGLSATWYTMANAIGILFLSLFLSNYYRKLNVSTVSEILDITIGKKTGRLSSIILMLVSLIIGTSQLIAIASIAEIFNIKYYITIIVFGLFITIFTIFGGIKSIGNMNIIHIVIMYSGIILSMVYLFIRTKNNGLSTLPSEYFNISSIGYNKISSWLLASMLGACTAQAGIQPILVAKNQTVAKKSSFLTALIVAPFGLLVSILGMFSKVIFPELDDSKLALPTLINEMNPIISGVLLSAIIASIMSTIAPIMLSFSTLFMKNIYKNKGNDKNSLYISKIMIFLFGTLCIVLASFLYSKTKILDFVYIAYSIRSALFVALILGIKWKKTTDMGTFWGIIISSIICLYWKIYYNNHGFFPIYVKLNETIIIIIATLVFIVLFSLITRKRKEMV